MCKKWNEIQGPCQVKELIGVKSISLRRQTETDKNFYIWLEDVTIFIEESGLKAPALVRFFVKKVASTNKIFSRNPFYEL